MGRSRTRNDAYQKQSLSRHFARSTCSVNTPDSHNPKVASSNLARTESPGQRTANRGFNRLTTLAYPRFHRPSTGCRR